MSRRFTPTNKSRRRNVRAEETDDEDEIENEETDADETDTEETPRRSRTSRSRSTSRASSRSASRTSTSRSSSRASSGTTRSRRKVTGRNVPNQPVIDPDVTLENFINNARIPASLRKGFRILRFLPTLTNESGKLMFADPEMCTEIYEILEIRSAADIYNFLGGNLPSQADRKWKNKGHVLAELPTLMILKDELLQYNSIFLGISRNFDSPYKCPKCQSNQIYVTADQTRKSDEGATEFGNCMNCGNRFRV